jgi:hypothetical protein
MVGEVRLQTKVAWIINAVRAHFHTHNELLVILVIAKPRQPQHMGGIGCGGIAFKLSRHRSKQ